MIWTAIWTPAAERRLTSIWLAASDRNLITATVSKLDEMLRRDPQSQGESRGGDVRVLFEHPLGIDFEVVEDRRKVYVLSVWRTDERKAKS